jgi:hypothetical protein
MGISLKGVACADVPSVIPGTFAVVQKYSTLGNGECDLCPSGQYCPGGTDAIDCPIGKYCPDRINSIDCPDGKFSDSKNSIVCIDWTPCGSNTELSNQSKTMDITCTCKPGYWEINSGNTSTGNVHSFTLIR